MIDLIESTGWCLMSEIVVSWIYVKSEYDAFLELIRVTFLGEAGDIV